VVALLIAAFLLREGWRTALTAPRAHPLLDA
jgi:hypothetical protein